MLDLLAPQPLAEAVAQISAKTPVGSRLKSADWEMMPLELRQRAQFSAGVESMRYLQGIQERMEILIRQERRRLADGTEGAFQARERFVEEMRRIAIEEGLVPEDPLLVGTLQDPSSLVRLNLIFDMQEKMASGYAQWKSANDPDLLQAFPAQELIRVEERNEPRDWDLRWDATATDAELAAFDASGRMIALVNSPTWTALSRFGTPYPPFDYNSGMGLRKIPRSLAEELGLLGPGDIVEPATAQLNAQMEASVAGLGQDYRDALKRMFGDRIDIDGDRVRWIPAGGTARTTMPAGRVVAGSFTGTAWEAAVRAIPDNILTGIPAPPPLAELAALTASGMRDLLADYAGPIAAALGLARRIADPAARAAAVRGVKSLPSALLHLPEGNRADLRVDYQTAAKNQRAAAAAGVAIASKIVSPRALTGGGGGHPLDIRIRATRSRRSFHRAEEEAVYLNKGAGAKTALHEIMHHIERQHDDVLRRSVAYHLDRVQDGDIVERLRDIAPGAGYKANEIALKDGFRNPYSGKLYYWSNPPADYAGPDGYRRRRASEILSMGAESYYFRTIDFAAEDPAYFDFIYDTLRNPAAVRKATEAEMLIPAASEKPGMEVYRP